MGIVDIKIDVMREFQWKKWSRVIVPNPQQQQSDLSNFGAADVNSDQYMGHELYWAATKSEAEFMSTVERLGTNVLLSVSPLGNTLLHIAAAHGNSMVVRQLSRHFSSLILSRNGSGDTPLHLAAEAGHNATVIELLSAVTDSNGAIGDMITRETNEQGNSPVQRALISSNKEVADALVQFDPEAMFCLNNEQKSGLYLAAEAGYEDMINQTLKTFEEEENKIYEMVKGRPPVHAAILGRHIGVLRILVEKELRLVQSRDEEGRTPLHLAALTGYLDGIEYLLDIHSLASVVRDNFGFFPVHWAAIQGHADAVEILLKHSPDPVELLDSKCRNILHIAAENGRKNVVTYILKNHDCKKLINARDREGNTPLHLATMNWHPRIVSELTWNENLDLKLTNNDGLTALDAAEFYIEGLSSFQQRLTWTALTAAGTPRAPPRAPPVYSQNLLNQLSQRTKPIACINNYRDRVNTLLVVATLIATVTFAAGFTVPGGYNSSDDPIQGQATLLRKKVFGLFIFCDTIAMYSAMIVTVSMIWAQMGDLNLVVIALRLGLWLLGVSLTMMSIAFMAGIYATVCGLHWLSHGVTIMGTVFFVTLTALSFPLCFPISSKRRILRCISYYPFRLLMYVTISGTSSNCDDKYIL